MRLSVVIPCFNNSKTISFQLEALAKQTWSESWEVIIADNGSNDTSLSIIKQYEKRLPNLKVVDASERPGAAHARNVGVLAAASEAVAFCDADDVIGQGWVAAMGEALAKYDFVAGRLECEKLNKPWVIKVRPCPQQDSLQEYTHPPYLPHGAGANLGVKTAIHKAVNGYDESLLRVHDTDYCWRIQLAGTKLHFIPEAVVHYRLRDSLPAIYYQAFMWGYYNVVLYKKYRSQGMSELLWQQGVEAWAGLLRQFWRLRYKGEMARWVWHVSWRLGRVRGCIKHRVLAL